MLVYKRSVVNHDDPEGDMVGNGKRSSSSVNPEGHEDMTRPSEEYAHDGSDSDFQRSEDGRKVNGIEDDAFTKSSDPGKDTNPFGPDSPTSNQHLHNGIAQVHSDMNPFDEDEPSHPPQITREDSNPFFDDDMDSQDDTNPFAEDTNQVANDTNPFAKEDDSNPFSENFTDQEQTLQITSSSHPVNSSKRVLTLDPSLSFSLEGVTTDESNLEAELQSPASTSTNPFDDEEDGSNPFDDEEDGTNPFGEEGDGTNPFDDDDQGGGSQDLPDEVFVNPEEIHIHLHLMAFCGHSYEFFHQIGIHYFS